MKRLDKVKDLFKRFDDFHKQGLIDFACDYMSDNKDNLLNCYKCGSKLGIWRMVYHARKVKRGEYYKIKCKRCVHVNKIMRRLKE